MQSSACGMAWHRWESLVYVGYCCYVLRAPRVARSVQSSSACRLPLYMYIYNIYLCIYVYSAGIFGWRMPALLLIVRIEGPALLVYYSYEYHKYQVSWLAYFATQIVRSNPNQIWCVNLYRGITWFLGPWWVLAYYASRNNNWV